MKKKWYQRAAAAGLAAVLVLSGLTGCGKDNAGNESSTKAENRKQESREKA